MGYLFTGYGSVVGLGRRTQLRLLVYRVGYTYCAGAHDGFLGRVEGEDLRLAAVGIRFLAGL